MGSRIDEADRLAVMVVMAPTFIMVMISIFLVLSVGYRRIIRNTPAVTRVEEWTKAEIGVGAAIASGNHRWKGSWALFVMAAMMIKI